MKRKIFGILFFLVLSANLYASCWTSKEKSQVEFYEMSDQIVISFKDAVDCKPIDLAVVELLGQTFQTDENGNLILSADPFMEMDDQDILIHVTRDGYIPMSANLRIIFGTVWNKMMLMSKKLSLDQVRFVLQWGKQPKDLDLHVKTNDFHISYRNMKNKTAKATLDRDSRQGFGPETITLNKIEDGKKYQVYVHLFSGRTTLDKRAQVFVYLNNKLDKTINLPKTNKRYVQILEINNDIVTYINEAKSKVTE